MPRALDPRLEAARTGYPGLTARPLPHGRGRVPSRPAVLRSGAVYWTCRSGTRRPRCGTRPHRCRGFWRGPPRISLGTCASTYDPGRRPLCRAWPRRPVGPDRGGCRMVRLLRRDDLTVGPVGSGRFGRADAGRHHVIEDAGEAAFHRGDPAPCVGRQQGCSLDGGHGVRAAGADATERCRRARCDAVCPTPGAEGRVDTVSMAGGDVEPLAPGGRQVSGGPHRASVHGMTRFMVDFGRQDRQGGACSDRSAR